MLASFNLYIQFLIVSQIQFICLWFQCEIYWNIVCIPFSWHLYHILIWFEFIVLLFLISAFLISAFLIINVVFTIEDFSCICISRLYHCDWIKHDHLMILPSTQKQYTSWNDTNSVQRWNNQQERKTKTFPKRIIIQRVKVHDHKNLAT